MSGHSSPNYSPGPVVEAQKRQAHDHQSTVKSKTKKTTSRPITEEKALASQDTDLKIEGVAHLGSIKVTPQISNNHGSSVIKQVHVIASDQMLQKIKDPPKARGPTFSVSQIDMANKNLNQDLKDTKLVKDRFGTHKLSSPIGSAAALCNYRKRPRPMQQFQKESAGFNTNLRIAYGSESLEGNLETQTIHANDSALMTANTATLNSPTMNIDSGRNQQIVCSKSRKKALVSESFDQKNSLKERFLSSPRTLRAETIETANSNSGAKFKFSTNKKINPAGFTNLTVETLRKSQRSRYHDKKKSALGNKQPEEVDQNLMLTHSSNSERSTILSKIHLQGRNRSTTNVPLNKNKIAADRRQTFSRKEESTDQTGNLQNEIMDRQMQLQIKIKKEDGSAHFHLVRQNKENKRDKNVSVDHSTPLETYVAESQGEKIPEFVYEYEKRRLALEEEIIFPSQEFLDDKRYNFRHKKLNYFEQTNQLRNILWDIQQSDLRRVPLFNSEPTQADEQLVIGGFVTQKNERAQDMHEALRTALQKGLITNNQIQKHVKLRNQLYQRTVKSQNTQKRRVHLRSRNVQNLEKQFISTMLGSNDYCDAYDPFKTTTSVFQGVKAGIHPRNDSVMAQRTLRPISHGNNLQMDSVYSGKVPTDPLDTVRQSPHNGSINEDSLLNSKTKTVRVSEPKRQIVLNMPNVQENQRSGIEQAGQDYRANENKKWLINAQMNPQRLPVNQCFTQPSKRKSIHGSIYLEDNETLAQSNFKFELVGTSVSKHNESVNQNHGQAGTNKVKAGNLEFRRKPRPKHSTKETNTLHFNQREDYGRPFHTSIANMTDVGPQTQSPPTRQARETLMEPGSAATTYTQMGPKIKGLDRSGTMNHEKMTNALGVVPPIHQVRPTNKIGGQNPIIQQFSFRSKQ